MAFDGTINFTGEISAASCKITGGAGTEVTNGGAGKQDITVSLGKVSADSIGTVEEGTVAGGTSISLNLDCGNTATDLSLVKMKFDPLAGSGLDGKNNQLLKVAGSAKGVGIGLFDNNNKLLNLAANETVNAPLVKGGSDDAPVYTAALNLRAGYVANGEKVEAGLANGTLPFTLSYE